jgi:hypothetical protein
MDFIIYYGTENIKLDITQEVLKKCRKDDYLLIPNGDYNRADLFTDPVPGVLKCIYIEKQDGTVMCYSDKIIIKIQKDFKIVTNTFINSALVCIAKLEHDYIQQFVKYYLKLGFNHIFIYDNEDVPVYNKLINNPQVTIVHFPGNNFHKGVQYIALEHFINNFINSFTHVSHFDIDEILVLKQQVSINDFISEYITGDCGAIGFNWRHFGSNGLTEKTDKPDIFRFTKCEIAGNNHIKTIFDVSKFAGWSIIHCIINQPGTYTKNTKGDIINGPFNENIDFSVAQLNHYKCKTLPEFQYIRTRGRADLNIQPIQPEENVIESFNQYNINEMEDYHACMFYSDNLTDFLNNFDFKSNYNLNINLNLLHDLTNIIKTLDFKTLNILEIGFNAGHSSDFFLSNFDCRVVSFDINSHCYTQFAKMFIDYKYPDRHQLIIGDNLPEYKYEIIFINGGKIIAKQDLENYKRFAHPSTLVIMNGTMYNDSWIEPWNHGPNQAWKDSITFIKHLHGVDYTSGRGMSWGKYKF